MLREPILYSCVRRLSGAFVLPSTIQLGGASLWTVKDFKRSGKDFPCFRTVFLLPHSHFLIDQTGVCKRKTELL